VQPRQTFAPRAFAVGRLAGHLGSYPDTVPGPIHGVVITALSALGRRLSATR
jgi:hypothetical protein